jgi:hypothetical protein
MPTPEKTYDEAMRDQDREYAVKTILQEFSRRILNTFDDSYTAEFVAQMAREHRTLQQGFTRLTVQWLAHLAALPEGHYDLRNEASVMLARKMLADAEKHGAFLPTI